MKPGPAARMRWGEMLRQKLNRLQGLTARRVHHPSAHKSRQCLIIGVLQLTAPANAKVSASGLDMMFTLDDFTVWGDAVSRHRPSDMPAAGCDTISLGGEADDCFSFNHRQDPKAAATLRASCDGVKAGPLSRAASPWSHTASQAA